MAVGDDIAGFDAASGAVETMQGAVSDRFLRVLTAVGDEEAVRSGIERYGQAGASSPCVGPIPGTDFEGTLRAAAPGRLAARRYSSTAADDPRWRRYVSTTQPKAG